MILTAVLLKAESFAEMQPLKVICHSKMYTITGYTVEQIICDDNGVYEDPKSAEKDYLVEMKGNTLKAFVVHKEGDKYIHKVRNGHSYKRVVVDSNEVYLIERYYRKNKSLSGLRHMVVKKMQPSYAKKNIFASSIASVKKFTRFKSTAKCDTTY